MQASKIWQHDTFLIDKQLRQCSACDFFSEKRTTLWTRIIICQADPLTKTRETGQGGGWEGRFWVTRSTFAALFGTPGVVVCTCSARAQRTWKVSGYAGARGQARTDWCCLGRNQRVGLRCYCFSPFTLNQLITTWLHQFSAIIHHTLIVHTT